MAGITFMATADEQVLTRFNVTSNASVSTTQARTNTRSFRVGGGTGCFLVRSVTGLMYARAAFFLTGSDGEGHIKFHEGSNLHFDVYIEIASGAVKVKDANTAVVGTYNVNAAINTWYVLEATGTIHDTTGTVTVKLNGVTVLTLTDLDTKFTGTTGICDAIRFTSQLSSANYTYVDDIMLRDDTWCGTGGIYLETVDGAGTDTDWTASAGAPYACVDEIPATFTDYIYSSTADHKSSFGLTAITNQDYAGITGVGAIAYGKLAAPGTANLLTYIDSGGTAALGSAVALDVSGVWVESYAVEDPDTTDPFDEAGINALLAGVKWTA
jgi:hypothetical protein